MAEYYIRKVRKEQNLTITELSKLSGVSKGYISQIESNWYQPTVEILCKLAKALNCSVEDLYKCK